MDGTPFGRYRLMELLGRGGMGEVFRAFDTSTERYVALKVLHSNVAHDEQYQERFRREARTAAALDEPHIVPIHDYGEIDGRFYVTMRLVTGRDLEAVLAGGPLPVERAVGIIEQVGRALDAAHATGLVHRDVKPSNILVAERDFTYLIDFGIARAAGDSGLTSTGSVMGTWAYMSPERLNTGRAEVSADVYALTCVLYEAITGQRPFPGDSLEQQVVGHLATAPPKPSEVVAGLPTGLDEVIATGMAKDPDARYRSAGDLGRAARAALLPTPRVESTATRQAPVAYGQGLAAGLAPTMHASALAPAAPKVRRRRGLKIAAIVSVAVLLVAGVAAWSLTDRLAPGESVLPFSDLITPRAIAVDGSGTVYVADANFQANRIATLAPGSTEQSAVPLTGLNQPQGVAVNRAGDVVVADTGNGRVLRLDAGSTDPTDLRFPGLDRPRMVAIDDMGTVYAAGDTTVWRLPRFTAVPTALDFGHPVNPQGLAATGFHSLYIADGLSNRVLNVSVSDDGAVTSQPLGFEGLVGPHAVAVDGEGTVYVLDGGRVVRLKAGSAARQRVLPFDGLTVAEGVAVDFDGRVYVVNSGDDARVLVYDQAEGG